MTKQLQKRGPFNLQFSLACLAAVLCCGGGVLHADLYDFLAPGASLALADYAFTGPAAAAYSGNTVAFADVDGDGNDDIVIGSFIGKAAYVVLSSSLTSSWGTSTSLSGADCVLTASSYVTCVANAGDVDGDGADDILLGENTTSIGTAYLVTGATITASGGAVALATAADYTFEAAALPSGYYENLGVSLAGGDFDGDGYADILIGACANPAETDEGSAYLFFARNLISSTPATLSVASDADHHFSNTDDDLAGYCVASAGDVDGSGKDDILIGAPRGNSTYLILGDSLPSGTTEIDLGADADYVFTGENSGDESGESVAGAGDVDGDGYADILIGSPDNGSGAGKAYLIFASILGADREIGLADADYSFAGENANDALGGDPLTWDHPATSVSGAGDVDGDGLDDILVGAYGYNGGAETGRTYLFLSAGLSGASSATNISASDADYIFDGEAAGDFSGWTVVGGGDVDGDGLPDILIGAEENDDAGTNAGKTYLILNENSCEPDDTIYVDGLLGTSSGPGGETCPYDTITGGISAAASAGISRVVVKGWFYDEVVTLSTGIELEGESRWIYLPPFILGDGSSNYIVEGAADSVISGFVLYGGGLSLDGINNMSVEGNVIFNDTWPDTYNLYFFNGASDNTVRNNIIYREHLYKKGLPAAAVYIEKNCDGNLVLNNSIHSRDYIGITPSPDVIGVWVEDYTQDNEFRNNIIMSVTHGSTSGTRYGIYMDWAATSASTATIEYNKTPADNYDPLGMVDSTNITSSISPRFIDPMPSGFNYHLRTGVFPFLLPSICIDAGDPDPSYDDTDGTRNDMGAYGGPGPIGF